MRRSFIVALFITLLINCYASTFPFSSASDFVNAVPKGWIVDNTSVHRDKPFLDAVQPASYGGTNALCIVFRQAYSGAAMYMTKTNAINDEVNCDNFVYSITVYVEPKGNSSSIDSVQPVISIDGGSFLPIGDAIPLKNDVSEPMWKTYDFVTNIQDAATKEIKIGLKAIAGGNSSARGYVRSISTGFRVCATIEKVDFLSDGKAWGSSLLDPIMESLQVRAKINANPDDTSKLQILENEVFVEFTANSTNFCAQLVKNSEDGFWYSDSLPCMDAGTIGDFCINVPYMSPAGMETLDKTNGLGVAEASVCNAFEVGKFGSVWINEITTNAIEFCGTTNRVYANGWKISVSNNAEGAQVRIIDVPFVDFNEEFANTISNKTGGVVGIACMTDVDFGNVAFPATMRLLNSSGIVEDEVVLNERPNQSWSRVNYAPWNEEFGWGYDWTGTATSGVFAWTNRMEASIGDVNPSQGFRTKEEKSIKISVFIPASQETEDVLIEFPNANVVVEVENFLNTNGAENFITNKATDSLGIALFNLSGWTPNLTNIYANISADAFGWQTQGKTEEIPRTNDTYECSVTMTPSTAVDNFQSKLSQSWVNEGLMYDSSGKQILWEVKNDISFGTYLCLNTARAYGVGNSKQLRCSNFLSPEGKRWLNISLATKTKNSNVVTDRKDLLTFLFSTNSTWDVTNVVSSAINDKNPNFTDGVWTNWSNQIRLSDDVVNAHELWLKLNGVSDGATSSELAIKNLRIAFQDMAAVTGLRQTGTETNPNFAIDVEPWCGDGQSVSNVSVDLVMEVNGTVFTNHVPWANGVLTNALAETTTFTFSNDVINAGLNAALGQNQLRVGDTVKYWAQVNYYADSRDPDPAKEWETRYFPDNAKVDGEGRWTVEGAYGVDMTKVASDYAFTVPGNPISLNGDFLPSETSVSFGFRAYDTAGVSNVTATISAAGAEAQIFNFVTNGVVRYDNEVSASGLAANTEYTVTITAMDAGGNPITPGTFTFWTLPEAPTVTVKGISTNAVMLTASGNAAGVKVLSSSGGLSSGWMQESANTWTNTWTLSGGPNDMFTATVCATNVVGQESASVVAVGYSLAAVATRAPAITKEVATVAVCADAGHSESVDGNPAGTEYAIRVTTSLRGDALVSDNGHPIWKTLAEWQTPMQLSVPTIDLAATNYFSFVTRNGDERETHNSDPVTTNCWFDMTAGFNEGETKQKSDGSVNMSLMFFDPAQSQDATVEVEYRIDRGEWRSLTGFAVQFADLSSSTNLNWNAWSAAGVDETQGEYQYGLRVKVSSGNRSSEWAEFSGTLDFMPPTLPVISGTPANEARTKDKEYSLSAASTDTNDITYHWTINNVSSTGSSLVGTAGPDDLYAVSVYATDAVGNVSPTNHWSWTLDTSKPTVELSCETLDPFNASASPWTVTATFSEPVMNFSASSVTVVSDNATVGGVTGSGTTYTFTVTPTVANGVISVKIGAGVVADAAGNPNEESTSLTRTYDTTAPTVELSCETLDPFNASASPWTVTATFSEPVTNFTASSVVVVTGNASVGGVTGSGTTYTFTVTPTVANGVISVKIGSGVVADAAGNQNEESVPLTRTYDTTAPTVELSCETLDPFNASASPWTVTATFSESVTNFTASSVVVVDDNASVGGVTGSGTTYTFTVTPTVANGVISVKIGSGVVADAAGNLNEESAPLSRRYDTTAPTVELSCGTLDPFNVSASPWTVTATFSEPVTNFTATSVTVVDDNAAVGGVTGSGTTYTFTVTPTVANGVISVKIGAGVVADAAGNLNEESVPLSRTYDTTAPTVELSCETLDPFNASASPWTVTATFSEPVTNFTASSVVVVTDNAAVGDVTGSGTTYTFTVTPTVANGVISVKIGAGVVADAAGNLNEESAPLSRRYDTTAPVVELSCETLDPFNASASPWTVTATFSEPVTNFTASSVIVVTGNASVGSVTGSGTTYTFAVTPTIANGDISVKIGAGVVADAAGNLNTESTSLTRTYDTTPPTEPVFTDKPALFVSEAKYSLTASSTDELSGIADYYWSVNGEAFAAGEATLSGEASGESQFTVSVYATDRAGNVSTTNTWSWTYDVTPPLKPAFIVKPAEYTNEKAYTITVSSSDNVSGVSGYFWSLNDGEFSSGVATLQGDATAEGLYTIRVYAVDGAGNSSATNSCSWTYDVTRPTVVELSSDTPDPFNAEAAPMMVTVKFSEAVTNFTVESGSLTVTNGIVSEIVNLQNSYTNYTVTIMPKDDGPVIVHVEENKVADYAGNGNEPSAVLTRTYDTTPPTVTITSDTPEPPALLNLAAMPFAVTVTFSEPVTNFMEKSVTVANGTVHELVNEQNSYTNYTVRITPANEDVTSISVSIGADAVTDLAGNGNDASNVLTRDCDVKRPTVLDIDFKQNIQTVNGLVKFSEPVTNFVLGSVLVENGQPTSVLHVRENEYMVTISANSGAETMALRILKDSLTDLAGNGNVASQKLHFTKNSSGKWDNESESPSSDIEFGGGVTLHVDSDTGVTNVVSFTSVEFKPGEDCTLTMSGFTATEGSIFGLQMWFVVKDTLDGEMDRVQADTKANFESGELTVTLPADKTVGKNSFFIFGIDNFGPDNKGE